MIKYEKLLFSLQNSPCEEAKHASAREIYPPRVSPGCSFRECACYELLSRGRYALCSIFIEEQKMYFIIFYEFFFHFNIAVTDVRTLIHLAQVIKMIT